MLFLNNLNFTRAKAVRAKNSEGPEKELLKSITENINYFGEDFIVFLIRKQ